MKSTRSVSDAVVLCGGAGLRLKSITGQDPKVMACVNGRPFLELILSQLGRHWFRRAILAVGYRKEAVISHFGEQACGLVLQYSVEPSPLGTGGALRNAANFVRSENVLVMNGDSYTDADLGHLLLMHAAEKADVSMVVVPVDGRSDCGSVFLAPTGRITRFEEKELSSGKIYANAGIYVFSRHMLAMIPEGTQMSLEKDMFPQWIRDGVFVRAFIHFGTCIDIGTPDRFRTATKALANAEVGAVTPRTGKE